MSVVKVDAARCKSCGLCVEFCPKKALSISDAVSKTGYAPVQVDEKKCIGCGICFYICPDMVFELD